LGKFTPADINPQLCTHLIYAFTVLDGEKLTIKTGDDWLDVESGNYKAFNDLKKENPNLKTLISLGGWVDSNDNRESYNLVFNNDKARETFINR
jgi:chitinase